MIFRLPSVACSRCGFTAQEVLEPPAVPSVSNELLFSNRAPEDSIYDDLRREVEVADRQRNAVTLVPILPSRNSKACRCHRSRSCICRISGPEYLTWSMSFERPPTPSRPRSITVTCAKNPSLTQKLFLILYLWILERMSGPFWITSSLQPCDGWPLNSLRPPTYLLMLCRSLPGRDQFSPTSGC
jgi:hypothetical protein